MKNTIRIIGLDPGLRKLGWGIVDQCGSRLSFVAQGVITPKIDQDMALRLLDIFNAVIGVIHTYDPMEAAIEETFVNMNPSSTLKLGHARAAAMLAPASLGLSVSEYAALDIKKSVVGAGRADKDQVQYMVKRLLPTLEAQSTKVTSDAADALACAITHAHRRKMTVLENNLRARAL